MRSNQRVSCADSFMVGASEENMIVSVEACILPRISSCSFFCCTVVSPGAITSLFDIFQISTSQPLMRWNTPYDWSSRMQTMHKYTLIHKSITLQNLIGQNQNLPRKFKAHLSCNIFWLKEVERYMSALIKGSHLSFFYP